MTTQLPLDGQSVLITGAGTRLGAAMALACAQRGADVAVHYRSSAHQAERVAASVRDFERKSQCFQADLGDAAQCFRLIDEVGSWSGGLNHLVSSAAIFERRELHETSLGDWEQMMATNVRAPFCLAQRAAPLLRERRGSMVILTCTSATTPYPHFLPYVVSKGAAKQLMKALALELAPEVRVNAIAPGTVLPPPSMGQSERQRLAERTLLQRLGSADDIVHALLYLLTAPFVTGTELLVDGGVAMAGRPSGEG